MVVEFIPEPGDLLAVNEAVLSRGRLARVGAWPSALLSAAVVGLAAGAAAWPAGVWWPILPAAALGGLLGWVVHRLAGRAIWRAAAGLQARMTWAAARRRGLLLPQRVEIAPEGLRTSSAHGETLTRWPAVREVVRTGDHVLLFVTPTTAFPAPRRAFPSREAFEAFGQEAEARRGGGVSVAVPPE